MVEWRRVCVCVCTGIGIDIDIDINRKCFFWLHCQDNFEVRIQITAEHARTQAPTS